MTAQRVEKFVEAIQVKYALQCILSGSNEKTYNLPLLTESREIRAPLKSEALASFSPKNFNYTNKENTFLLLVNKRSHSEAAPTIINVII